MSFRVELVGPLIISLILMLYNLPFLQVSAVHLIRVLMNCISRLRLKLLPELDLEAALLLTLLEQLKEIHLFLCIAPNNQNVIPLPLLQ